jgi:hypothetical protein
MNTSAIPKRKTTAQYESAVKWEERKNNAVVGVYQQPDYLRFSAV